MLDHPVSTLHTLTGSLEALEKLVMQDPTQPTTQLAENGVLLWTRVLEQHDVVQPRLAEHGYSHNIFHFGMERLPRNRLDDIPPSGEPAGYRMEFEERLSRLGEHLGQYFEQNSYRSSSDTCDRLMIELTRFSRFLSTRLLEGEPLAIPTAEGEPPHERWAGEPSEPPPFRQLVLRDFLIWEPMLNEAIVVWDQNSLHDYERALRAIEQMRALPGEERERHRVPPGFPLRSLGKPRLKVTVFEPVLRPLRAKSMFSVRLGQLMRRINELGELPPEVIRALVVDINHFHAMILNNHYMLGGDPGFWPTHRSGLPVIRGRHASHPFLIDPSDFIKKAVLFHNGTYTIAGGGVDRMFLQVRQLERYYKFHGRGSRRVRDLIESCKLGWEENKWDAFTDGLLLLAEHIRANRENGKG